MNPTEYTDDELRNLITGYGCIMAVEKYNMNGDVKQCIIDSVAESIDNLINYILFKDGILEANLCDSCFIKECDEVRAKE